MKVLASSPSTEARAPTPLDLAMAGDYEALLQHSRATTLFLNDAPAQRDLAVSSELLVCWRIMENEVRPNSWQEREAISQSVLFARRKSDAERRLQEETAKRPSSTTDAYRDAFCRIDACAQRLAQGQPLAPAATQHALAQVKRDTEAERLRLARRALRTG